MNQKFCDDLLDYMFAKGVRTQDLLSLGKHLIASAVLTATDAPEDIMSSRLNDVIDDFLLDMNKYGLKKGVTCRTLNEEKST